MGDYEFFCRKYMNCSGRKKADGGDGTCPKFHGTRPEVTALVAQRKANAKADREKANGSG